jgi:hypothetical protein
MSESDHQEKESDPELPADVREEVERLTRLARNSVDDGAATAYREGRDELLAEHGFVARVREDKVGETLVCYPEEWVADGVVQIERIEDTDRAAEISLEGPGDPENWDAVDEHNRELVADVEAEHGEVHAETADAFADFIANHYAKRIEAATEQEIEEFLTEYFPRNAWPSEDQRERAERSVRLLQEAAST